MPPRRALVTGGLGFIGSALVRRLVSEGWDVAVIDALVEGHGGDRRNLEGVDAEVVVADLSDRKVTRRLARGRDALFHLAGQRSHVDSMREPATDLDHNCRAALSLLEAWRAECPKARLACASTRQVYGRPERLPVDERHPTRPVDVNGVHKLAVENYLKVYEHAYGLRSCVLRLTNTYGPRMRVADARQGFLGLWVRELIEGRGIEVFGDGAQRRDFNYVDDVVDAFMAAAVEDGALGRVMNLGSAPSVSLKETAELLIALNGSGSYRLRPFPPEHRAIDIGDYAADFSLASSVLGWSPKVGLADGLKRTLDYFVRCVQ